MTKGASDHVTLFEMSPRDGLQNEPRAIPTADKIKLVNLLSDTGLSKIEVASFVNPKAVPQMADGGQLMGAIRRVSGVSYSALTPNMRGFEAAMEAKPDEVAVFASASEGFSQANINCSIDESLARFEPVMEAARAVGIPVRGYVSCIVACPYDGLVPPKQTASVAQRLLDMGCYEISLGDTIGAGTPKTIRQVLDEVLAHIPAHQLAGHYHDTNRQALANIEASLEMGLRIFDASAGGLGGCPFAPGAAGNVATEALLDLLNSLGFHTGIDASKLAIAGEFAQTLRTGS